MTKHNSPLKKDNEKVAYGTHLQLDLIGCSEDIVKNIGYWERLLKDAANKVGLKVAAASAQEVKYAGDLITVLFETGGYIIVQTWIDDKYISVDGFVRDVTIDIPNLANHIVDTALPTYMERRIVDRII